MLTIGSLFSGIGGMERTPILVEGCAGMAAVSWSCFGMAPPVKYKGGKRSYASDIRAALRLVEPEEIVLVEAVREVACALRVAWSADLRAAAVDRYRSWAGPEEDQRERWASMLGQWGEVDDVEAGIRWLWMRPRTAAMVEPQRARPGDWLRRNQARTGWNEWRLDTPATSLSGRLPDTRTTVVHGDIRNFAPIRGAVLYLDPPYQGTKGYEASLSRSGVFEVAERWAGAGCLVGVSEAEPLSAEVVTPKYRGARGRNFANTAEYLSIWRPR